MHYLGLYHREDLNQIGHKQVDHLCSYNSLTVWEKDSYAIHKQEREADLLRYPIQFSVECIELCLRIHLFYMYSLLNKILFTPNRKGPYQLLYPCSLINAFIIHFQNPWIQYYIHPFPYLFSQHPHNTNSHTILLPQKKHSLLKLSFKNMIQNLYAKAVKIICLNSWPSTLFRKSKNKCINTCKTYAQRHRKL